METLGPGIYIDMGCASLTLQIWNPNGNKGKGKFDYYGPDLKKKELSSGVTNKEIDSLVNDLNKDKEIYGTKLLGAGGGGFFIFYVPPFRRHALITYLKTKNLTIQPFRFEPDGLKTWTSREHVNHAIGQ